MANSSLRIDMDNVEPLLQSGKVGKELLVQLRNRLDGAISGAKRSSTVRAWIDGTAPVVARATTTISGGAGTITATINGVAVAVSFTTSDINTATLLAAAINASVDALVQYIVRASNFAMTITLASVAAGEYVDIGGYRFIAQSGGVLAGDAFDVSGTDTADATSLTTQLNARPGLRDLFIASSSAGVVTLRQISGTTAAATIYKNGAGITLSGALAATATTLVSAIAPGVLGNCVTLAATGTGHTASAARLASGTGQNVTPVVVTT